MPSVTKSTGAVETARYGPAVLSGIGSRSVLVSALGSALAVTMPASAEDAHPSARLLYTRAEGAEACPDTRALRDAVTMRLGYDPFDAGAATTVEARVEPSPRGFRADVRLFDADGAEAGERELTSNGSDCAALASALALTVSILVDPRSLTRKPGTPPPTAKTSAAPPPEAAAPGRVFDAADVHDSPFDHAPPAPPPKEPVHVRVGLAGLASVGAAPSLATGVAALVGIARGPFSLDLEGRADLPASSFESDGSAIRSSLLLAGLVPCYAASVVRMCVVGTAGVLRGEGIGVVTPDRDETFYAAAGGRFGVEPPIGAGLRLRVYADGLAPIVRTTLRAVGREASWTTPPVFVTGGLGLAKVF